MRNAEKDRGDRVDVLRMPDDVGRRILALFRPPVWLLLGGPSLLIGLLLLVWILMRFDPWPGLRHAFAAPSPSRPAAAATPSDGVAGRHLIGDP